MRVFEILSQWNDIQSMNVTDDKMSDGDLLHFDCSPKMKKWKNVNPMFQITTPEEKASHFFNLVFGSLAFNHNAYQVCEAVFMPAGGILPLQLKNHEQLYA